jgi:hypothetical protein
MISFRQLFPTIYKMLSGVPLEITEKHSNIFKFWYKEQLSIISLKTRKVLQFSLQLKLSLIISNNNDPDTNQPNYAIQAMKKEISVYQMHIAKHIQYLYFYNTFSSILIIRIILQTNCIVFLNH